MNTVINIAVQNGREYITPEDVDKAMMLFSVDPHRVRIDVLEVLGKQTPFGVEDWSLCAFLAFKGSNVKLRGDALLRRPS